MTAIDAARSRLQYAAACARAIETARAFIGALDQMAALGDQIPGEPWESVVAADAIRVVFAEAAARLPGLENVFPNRKED